LSWNKKSVPRSERCGQSEIYAVVCLGQVSISISVFCSGPISSTHAIGLELGNNDEPIEVQVREKLPAVFKPENRMP